MNADQLKRFGAIVASLWVAAILQSGASAHMTIFGARPDFLLVLGLLWPLVLKPSAGCVVGFFSGVLLGWVSGVSLTINAIVRALFGYACGLANRTGFDIDQRAASVIVASGTLLAQFVVFFAAPPSDRLGYVRATIGTALYNGVLAYPVYWGIRRLSGPKDDFML